jgi:hypothetical protein
VRAGGKLPRGLMKSSYERWPVRFPIANFYPLSLAIPCVRNIVCHEFFTCGTSAPARVMKLQALQMQMMREWMTASAGKGVR